MGFYDETLLENLKGSFMKKSNKKTSPQSKRLLLIIAAVIIIGLIGGKSIFTPTEDPTVFEPTYTENAGKEITERSVKPTATPEASKEVLQTEAPQEPEDTAAEESVPPIDEDGIYTTKDDVALYIYTYGKLPSNFMKKSQAQKLGWTGGGLDRYKKNACIGGDRFGNYEGILPEKRGRFYTECDIDTLGKNSRGAKRIVFSNDGLIYYTDDHYESFELLYGEE